MFVSVIMPVFNSEKYLRYSVESVIEQTFTDWELICVDDGSSDLSLEILNGYAENDDRIKVISIENSGVSYARNLGLTLAKGDYITFLDSDDYISKNLYEEIYKVTKTEQFELCIVGIERVKDFYKRDILFSEKIVHLNYRVLVDRMNSCKSNIIGGVVNKFYRRNLLSGMLFDEDIAITEDMLFNCQVMKKCSNIIYLKEPYYKYYIANQNSASKNVYYSEKGYNKLKSGILAYSKMMECAGEILPLKASQSIMYMNLLLIQKQLNLKDNQAWRYKRIMWHRLRDVLRYDGIDIKHKLTYCVCCINTGLALFIRIFVINVIRR